MAQMFDGGLEEFETDGERDFYRFIETCAKPDGDFRCWYSPDLDSLVPDFVLFGKEIGLVVFEVKDWSINQVDGMGQKSVDLIVNSQVQKRPNPYWQANSYKNRLLDLIKKDGRLVSKHPDHYGKITVPVGRGVVFPNISRRDFENNGFGEVIPAGKVFFLDDLHPESEICRDESGDLFRREAAQRFKPLFPCTLSGREIDHLGSIIAPERRGCLPKRGKAPDYQDQGERIYALDNNQTCVARRYLEGHHIFEGPSGCGKTLVLAHKADLLMRHDAKIRSILFVCYNVTLVNYIRRLLMARGTPLGKNGVDVMHIYELCARVLGEEVRFEGEDAEMYQLYLDQALERLPGCGITYDAVLIDEGQDFSDAMYDLVVGLLNKETNSLTVALDDNQRLYRTTNTWKKKGIAAQGRVHQLHHVYRNTKEIAQLASCFCALPRSKDNDPGRQPELFGDYYVKSGPRPILEKCACLDDCLDSVGASVEDLVRREVYSPSEIAILYTRSNPGEDRSVHLPTLIEEALSSRGIISGWVAKNYQAKRSYDITTERVTVSTIHSAKGMDYGCVFLLGLEYLDGSRWDRQQIDNLIYVGITRARYQLFIPYVQESGTIRRLQVAYIPI